MLIHGADAMGGSSDPDGDRGFGRVRLESAMPFDGEDVWALYIEDYDGTTTGTGTVRGFICFYVCCFSCDYVLFLSLSSSTFMYLSIALNFVLGHFVFFSRKVFLYFLCNCLVVFFAFCVVGHGSR